MVQSIKVCYAQEICYLEFTLKLQSKLAYFFSEK